MFFKKMQTSLLPGPQFLFCTNVRRHLVSVHQCRGLQCVPICCNIRLRGADENFTEIQSNQINQVFFVKLQRYQPTASRHALHSPRENRLIPPEQLEATVAGKTPLWEEIWSSLWRAAWGGKEIEKNKETEVEIEITVSRSGSTSKAVLV